jgi:protein O-mannosyl-transferase
MLDDLDNINSPFIPLTTTKAIAIIVIIRIIVYANMLFNGFVWDDLPFIIENPEVHQLNLPALLGQNMFNSGPFYRPLPAIYFATVYSLFGANAFIFHILQLFLHLVGTCLLFIFFSRFFTHGISFFLALIFLVHPINVESVAHIGSTQSQLYFIPRHHRAASFTQTTFVT